VPTYTLQNISGTLAPTASRDAWRFSAEPGTNVTITVDTVSEETAYTLSACISSTPATRDCIKPVTRTRVDCSFPPPFGKCPVNTYVLPADSDGIYYFIVNGFRFFANPKKKVDGEYVGTLSTSPGVGRIELEVDNGTGEEGVID
jgi:hypothetical protein